MDNIELYLKALAKRGPEGQRILDISGVGTLGFTRLAINGLTNDGMQPFSNEHLTWMCNGEIYNWVDLATQYDLTCTTGSDCEVLGPLYESFMNKGLSLDTFFRSLDGVFALVIVDRKRNQVIIGRDPYGVRPLFIGTRYTNTFTYSSTNTRQVSVTLTHLNTVFASELKAMTPLCSTVNPFPPGTYQVYELSTGSLLANRRYHEVPWLKNPMYSELSPFGAEFAAMAVRQALESAVLKRMMTERPTACLLSGGVDSSLIASLVAKLLRNVGAPPLHTFSIGMEGSTDLKYARKVANWIGSEHHEIVLTADDFFRAIPAVIYDIESYDTTTVRASVGNWLVAREIRRQTDCKVVFNGDGSDEVWGSYLYFYKAPTEAEFEVESQRLLQDIHYFDVLRSDRSISSHGLEPRTPFLDKQFVATAMSVATKWRRPIQGDRVEKWILRKAFDDGITLPHDVLWRRKEAFSDGVSSREEPWYKLAQRKAEELMGDDWKQKAELKYSHLRPTTAEQMYYRFCYDSSFSNNHPTVNVPYFWMPRWCEGATDPSARTLDVYATAGQ